MQETRKRRSTFQHNIELKQKQFTNTGTLKLMCVLSAHCVIDRLTNCAQSFLPVKVLIGMFSQPQY